MFVTTLLFITLGLALSLAISGAVTEFVRRIGWIDNPDDRKVHVGQVPLAGGLLMVATVSPILLGLGLAQHPVSFFWACGLIIFIVAFIDDRFPIRARYRFLTQLVAAALASTLGDAYLVSLGQWFGPFEFTLGALAIPFAVLAIVAFTNASNMLDGMDGLAGGNLAVGFGLLIAIFSLIAIDSPIHTPQGQLAFDTVQACAAVLGALLGFLCLNQRSVWRDRASIFMGDGGSMLLGFLLVVLGLFSSSRFGVYSLPFAVLPWLLALPILDLSAAIVRRLLAGVTPMTPDRKHIHHLLLTLGLPTVRIVPLLQLVSMLLGLIGIWGWRAGVPQFLLGWGFALLCLVYLGTIRYLWAKLEHRIPEPSVAGQNPPAGFVHRHRSDSAGGS